MSWRDERNEQKRSKKKKIDRRIGGEGKYEQNLKRRRRSRYEPRETRKRRNGGTLISSREAN